jgi:hypothetical protein
LQCGLFDIKHLGATSVKVATFKPGESRAICASNTSC